jgi:hypothetical protein
MPDLKRCIGNCVMMASIKHDAEAESVSKILFLKIVKLQKLILPILKYVEIRKTFVKLLIIIFVLKA